MKEFTDQERMEYLLEKRKWLQGKGMDLRPSRLVELNNLLKRAVDGSLRQHELSSRTKKSV